ncbi:penicillin acylase family protein [Maribacter sp. 2307UL18-2]|uniref:penicillin acylase family protein n=1 Tax=Maribacter sp. 2307UL18-2 TaxID=3386274 RepID=UPI0039BC7930
MKLLRRIGRVLMVLVGILAIGTAIFTYSLKPDYDGEKTIVGLSAAVEVYFDRYGVPHIYGNEPVDAFRALGYVHAQDRLWQMELLRRIGRGGLSEVFGETTLETDKFFLALGIDESSARAVAKLDPNSEAVVLSQAYLDGINEFVKDGPTPLEFYLTGLEKTEFTLHDIQNVFGYMAFSFAQAHKTDPLLTKIKDSLGSEYLNDFDIAIDPKSTLIQNFKGAPGKNGQTEVVSSVIETLESLHIPLFEGSNGWVVGPEKTKNGKVIFANDPHIGFAQPSVWYEAHVVTPTYEKYGYHLAGIPFPALAHDRTLAYGMTMFENDDTDFYYEEVNPQDPDKYRWKNTWVPFETKAYSISVKDGDTVDFTVKKTRRGPVLSGVMNEIRHEKPISMWWTYTQNENQAMQALYEMATARNIVEFKDALPKIHAPGLNIMYGDVEGNIAWWATAKLHKVPDSINTKLIQVDQKAYPAEREYLPFTENPQAINPPWHYVYSANNQPDSIAGQLYPGYYLPENRAKRIVELLEPKNDWDRESIGEMLTDVTSAVNPSIVKNLSKGLDIKVLNSVQLELLDQLYNWKGDYPTSSVEAALYHRWIYYLLKDTFEDELGATNFNRLLKTHLLKRNIAKMVANPRSIWWNDVRTEANEKQSDMIQKSFSEAFASLENDLGKDPSDWTWNKLHTLEHGHPIGQAGGLLRSFFNVGPFPIHGSREVINNLGFGYSATGYYEVGSGPSTRRVVDFSDIENSMSILPTGQSGNPFSKYYQDQAEMYVKGAFRKMQMNRTAITEDSDSKLILIPK